MIIGFLGFAQTGKSAAGTILNNNGFQSIAFADELKRICMRLFQFTEQQLWGEIKYKEAVDTRYPRESHAWDRRATIDEPKCMCCGMKQSEWLESNTSCYLTPRYALQIIGTEGGRQCYDKIWVDTAMETARWIQKGSLYNRLLGIEDTMVTASRDALFTDVRFINEVNAIRSGGGKVYRIKRKGYENPNFNHPSETEQLKIPDDKLDGVINNDGTLEDFEKKVLAVLQE